MRYSAILVPSAIVVSIFVIVGAEAGWFDDVTPEPAIIRAEAGIHGTRVASHGTAPTTGRSVHQEAARRPAPTAVATKPSDTAKPAETSKIAEASRPAAAPDALAQARRDADQARQDVVDVTQASIAAQAASETEMARQKAELDAKIAALQTRLDAKDADHEKALGAKKTADDRLQADLAAARDETARLKKQLAARADAPDIDVLRQRAATVAQAEAAAATATAELADARARETTLRQALAGRQVAAQDKAGDERAARDLAAARDQAKTLEGQTKALEAQTKALEAKVAELTTKAATADEAARQLDAMRSQVAALSADKAKADKVASGPDALAGLRDDLAGARRGQATLRQENAVLQRELTEARQASTADQVADAGPEPQQDGRSVADTRSAVALAGALRTAEAELAQMRAARARDATQLDMLHRLLANLGPPRQQQGARIVRIPADEPRRARVGASNNPFVEVPATRRHVSEEAGSSDPTDARTELRALRREADAMARAQSRQ